MEEKKISTKILLKSGFWYTVSNYLTRALVFITMPLFTRILTKEQYGDFSVFASWQAMLVIVCGLEVYSTINRARFDYPDKKDFDSYITSSLVLSTLLTAAVYIVYLLFPELFDRLFLVDRKYMTVMFAYLFTYPVFAMFQTKQRIEYKYKLSSAISFFTSILSAALSVVLALVMSSDRLFGRILGQYSLFVVVGLLLYFYFLRRSHKVTVSAWKYALRMGFPIMFSYLGSQMLLSADNLILKHMCSAEAVSYVSVIHSCSHILLLLVQTLNGAWAPWVFDMLKIGDTKAIRKTYQVYLWAMIVCTFGVLLFGPEIVLILGGPEYHEAIYILPISMLCGVFTVLTAQFSNLETYYKKPEYTAVLTSVAAVLNVFLAIVGVKLWGYRAVCYATALCQLVLIGLHYRVTLKMGTRELLPLRNLLLALAVSLMLVPVSLLLYRSNVIRYGFIGILVAAVVALGVIYRAKILGWIKQFGLMK